MAGGIGRPSPGGTPSHPTGRALGPVSPVEEAARDTRLLLPRALLGVGCAPDTDSGAPPEPPPQRVAYPTGLWLDTDEAVDAVCDGWDFARVEGDLDLTGGVTRLDGLDRHPGSPATPSSTTSTP